MNVITVDLTQAQSFKDAKTEQNENGSLKMRVREVDGYVYLSGLCHSNGKEFHRYWEQDTNRDMVADIARELGIPFKTETTSNSKKTKASGDSTQSNHQPDHLSGGPSQSDHQSDHQNTAETRTNLGAVHYVKHGDVSVRGHWGHPRVALEVMGWISPAFKLWANGILYRYLTGRITTEESQLVASSIFTKKGTSKPLMDIKIPSIYFAQVVGCPSKGKLGKTNQSIAERHDMAHARSYDPIDLTVAFAKADTTSIETSLISYSRKHKLMEDGQEHFDKKAVQEHFGYPDKKPEHILASFLLHVDGVSFLVPNPMDPNAKKVYPEGFIDYCDIDEDKVNELLDLIEKNERVKRKRKAITTDDDESMGAKRLCQEYELKMKRLDIEMSKINLEKEKQSKTENIELRKLEQTENIELRKLQQAENIELKKLDLEAKRLEFEFEKWKHEKSQTKPIIEHDPYSGALC